MYGGAALNAAHALVTMLSRLIARDGRLAEPLRQGIVPPTEEELAGWRELPPGADELAEQGARPADPRAAEEFYLRTFAEPALDVNGIESGLAAPPEDGAAGRGGREPLDPARAGPARRGDRARASSGCCASPRPAGAELELELWSSSPPGLVPPDAKAIQLGLDAFERALGRRPALVRSGGTLPIVPALADKGIPTIITGFGLPGLADPLAERAPASPSTSRSGSPPRASSSARSPRSEPPHRSTELAERRRPRRAPVVGSDRTAT